MRRAMGVERGRRRVGGIVITCSSCARCKGSPRSRARAVGHGIGFRAQHSVYPYTTMDLQNPSVIMSDALTCRLFGLEVLQGCYALKPHFSFLWTASLVTSSLLPHHSAYYPLLTPLF